MITVRDILQNKGTQVYSTTPGSSVFGALELMARHNVGALLVMEEKKLIGMFSERDYARKVILKGKSSRETLVREIMTPNPLVIAPERTIRECLTVMTERQVRHLPVLDGTTVLGVISIGDVGKTLIADHEDTIDKLETYIKGR
jgi:CBS domain-containing protein